MASAPSLHLSLEAHPESVGSVRRAVGALAETSGMREPQLGDLKTVVSEACANVVLHAYPDGGGYFEVEARAESGEIAVVIRDFGVGLRPEVRPERTSLRLGLGLIAALAGRYEIFGHPEGGTEVRIGLPLQA